MSIQLLIRSMYLFAIFASRVFLFYLLISFIVKISQFIRNIRHFKNFPQDKGHYLFGDVFRLMPTFPFPLDSQSTPLKHAVDHYLQKFRDRSLFIVWLAWYPVVICKDYRSAEVFLSSKSNLEKAEFYDFLDPRFKNGLIGSEVEKWRKRRKMVLPAFNRKSLENFVPIVASNARKLARRLNENKGKVIDIKDPIYLVSFDIICQLIMGLEPDSCDYTINSNCKPDSALVTAVASFTKPIMARIVNPIFRIDSIFFRTQMGQNYLDHVKIFDQFSSQAIQNRMTHLESIGLGQSQLSGQDWEENVEPISGRNKRSINGFCKSLLDHLITLYLEGKHQQHGDSSAGLPIDLVGIKEEMDNSLAAGYETTAIAIMWTIYLLGLHPEIQRKVWEEVSSIMDLGDNQELTIDQINGMSYLEQCIKEGIRLIPPLPMIARRLDEEVTLDGYRFPKGTTIGIMIHMIHHDPKIYPEPEVFDPDRFSPDRVKNIPAYGFIPFSAGPRNCLGQKFAYLELKIILSHIIKHFEIVSMDPLKDVPYEYEMITAPKHQLNVKFIPRNNQ